LFVGKVKDAHLVVERSSGVTELSAPSPGHAELSLSFVPTKDIEKCCHARPVTHPIFTMI
jgi:hypothetical protein